MIVVIWLFIGLVFVGFICSIGKWRERKLCSQGNTRLEECTLCGLKLTSSEKGPHINQCRHSWPPPISG